MHQDRTSLDHAINQQRLVAYRLADEPGRRAMRAERRRDAHILVIAVTIILAALASIIALALWMLK